MTFKTLFMAMTLAIALPAQAALEVDRNNILPGVTVSFDAYDGLITQGPETLAPGVVFSSDQDAELGANIADLGNNGLWGAGSIFAASLGGELRFSFDGPVRGAGALVNYYQDGTQPDFVTITAYGADNLVLESHTVTIDTDLDSLNVGQFVGILRDTADLRAISYAGTGVVVDDLVAAVPEPETYAMMLAGLGLVGLMARRRAA